MYLTFIDERLERVTVRFIKPDNLTSEQSDRFTAGVNEQLFNQFDNNVKARGTAPGQVQIGKQGFDKFHLQLRDAARNTLVLSAKGDPICNAAKIQKETMGWIVASAAHLNEFETRLNEWYSKAREVEQMYRRIASRGYQYQIEQRLIDDKFIVEDEGITDSDHGRQPYVVWHAYKIHRGETFHVHVSLTSGRALTYFYNVWVDFPE